MKLKMYDIGRNDCILLNGNKKGNLMIDCGVQKRSKKIRDINKDLLSEKRNHLIVTHFHEDHIRGLNYIKPNMFDQINVSRYMICLFTENELNTLVLLLKLYAYTPLKTAFNIYLWSIITILNNFARVLKKGSKVIYVNKGSKLNYSKEFVVIHPDIQCEGFFKDEFLRKAREYVTQMEKKHNKDTDIISEYIKEFTNNVKEIFIQQNSEYLTFNKYKKELNILKEVVAKMAMISERREINAEHEYLYNDFKKYMNYYSIVFHNKKALFCGDATKEVINNLNTTGEFYSNYTAVKTPHHGSSTHFSLSLPRPTILLSCSNSIKDIDLSNKYIKAMPKINHIFSNGDMFLGSKIYKYLFMPDITINI